jgi:hypothetical protein
MLGATTGTIHFTVIKICYYYVLKVIFFFNRTECEGLDVCIGPLIKYSGKYIIRQLIKEQYHLNCAMCVCPFSNH